MTIEKKLREVAKERIRKAIRDGENMEIVLKYDTPDEKVVSSNYLSWYREILNDEWKQYNAGKKSEATMESRQATRSNAKSTTKQGIKKSVRTGRFCR